MKRLAVLVLRVVALPASASRPPIVAPHDWWPVFSPDSGSIAFIRVSGQGRVFTPLTVPANDDRCDPGRDTVWAHRPDRTSACEVVHR